MTVACLLVPSLALACELARRPALVGQPVVLTDAAGLRVADATPEAAARGVRAGQTLREAAGYCPTLTALEPRPARVARALERLAAALGVVSPLVETPPAASAGIGVDALYADLRGTEALFPRPGDLERAVLGALTGSSSPTRSPHAAPPRGGTGSRGALRREPASTPRPAPPLVSRAAPIASGAPAPPLPDRTAHSASMANGFVPRLGIADRRFTAFAAARTAAPGTARRVAGDEATAFLASLPAEWLPLSDDALTHLRLLGLRTLGAFAALPRHAVEAQFGFEGGRAWLAARGEDPAPVRADPVARERVIEHAQSQPPLVSREAVTGVVEQLLGRALRHPRVRRRFVRALRLRAITEDDRLWERVHTMKEPTGDRARLWLAIRPLLEYADYPGPIAELELELSGLTTESGRQVGLFVDRTRRREQLDEMVRHLKLRYGQSPVARVVDVEPWSRVPERRHALMDYEP
ncbi:MAG: hypothetical protein WEB13_01195 [Dehalococcoidia bacterium]